MLGLPHGQLVVERLHELENLRRWDPHPGHDARGHVICGHLHPVLKLPGQPRTPAFWLQAGCTVLPAFSAFTGGQPLRLAGGETAVLCNGHALVAVGAR